MALIYQIKIYLLFRLQDEENENPCFPTRNDRMAFINDNIVRERCVCLKMIVLLIIFYYSFLANSS